MTICGISDIHGNLYNKIPECDVLCICGDIVPLNIQRDNDRSGHWLNTNFINWINTLSCEKVIIVPGNHDFVFEKHYLIDNAINFIPTLKEKSNKLEVLIDELYEYKGVTFYGTPWIKPIMFQEGRWAFELPPATKDEHIYNKIPHCDILLSHDNPNYNNILDYYATGKYKHHLFGHWHDGIVYKNLNQHNCSLLNDMYNFRKETQIVTIEFDNMAAFNKRYVIEQYTEYLVNKFKGVMNTNVSMTNEDIIYYLNEFCDNYDIVGIPTEEDLVEWNTSLSEEEISNIVAESEALFTNSEDLLEEDDDR